MLSKNGFEYEKIVIEALKSSGISGIIKNNAGSNSIAPDADFKIHDQIYNLEIKLNDQAQMGGSSILFNKVENNFSLCSPQPIEIEKLLLEVISTKQEELVRLIDFIKYEERNLVIQQKIPFSCSKETWELAQQKNLLVNVKIPCSIEFLKHHLKKKNINYIQIGGKGLYYVNSNPANLPIEELQGNFTVEIRTGRSGSKQYPKGNFKFVTGAIRVQGRLNILNRPSDYTLDSTESIGKLIHNMNFLLLENNI